MSTVFAVQARDITPGLALWVSYPDVAPWIGPMIDRVEALDADRVRLHTVNGGERVCSLDEWLQVVDLLV